MNNSEWVPSFALANFTRELLLTAFCLSEKKERENALIPSGAWWCLNNDDGDDVDDDDGDDDTICSTVWERTFILCSWNWKKDNHFKIDLFREGIYFHTVHYTMKKSKSRTEYILGYFYWASSQLTPTHTKC